MPVPLSRGALPHGDLLRTRLDAPPGELAMTASITTAITPRADLAPIARYAAATRGGHVIADLSDSTNAWGPSPAAARAAAEGTAKGTAGLASYPTLYGDDLKTALARYHGVAPSQIVTGCGSDDVIRSAFAAFAAPGAVITWMEPTFVMIPVFARILALDIRPVPFDTSFAVRPDELLARRAAVTYLCSPNNPTGSRAARAAVARVLAEAPGLVVMDEAYADFAGETWIGDAAASGRLLVARTFSKSFGLAGLRAGYGVAHADIVEAIEKVRGPYSLNAVAERAAVAAITSDVAWMRATVSEAIASRDRLAAALRGLGYAPLDSAANFLTTPVRDAAAVAEECAQRGVIVRGFRGLAVIGDAVRVAMAPWSVLERVVEAFAGVPR